MAAVKANVNTMRFIEFLRKRMRRRIGAASLFSANQNLYVSPA